MGASTGSAASRRFHAVQFYGHKTSLGRTVADFLCEGFADGQPGLVVATLEHRDAIVLELRARHIDVDALRTSEDLLLLDARVILSSFMSADLPNATLFHTQIPPVLDRLCRRRKGCTVRAYGEMVDVLWQDGMTDAAIRLEMLWNQLGMLREFSLLCGYASKNFPADAGKREVCAHHSHVIAGDISSPRPSATP